MLNNREKLQNILETMRTREHDVNKSQEVTIAGFVVGNPLRVSQLL